MNQIKWGVLSEDGTVYGVGRWKNGRERHAGAFWLAVRECRLLRRSGERRAKVVRLRDQGISTRGLAVRHLIRGHEGYPLMCDECVADSSTVPDHLPGNDEGRGHGSVR